MGLIYTTQTQLHLSLPEINFGYYNGFFSGFCSSSLIFFLSSPLSDLYYTVLSDASPAYSISSFQFLPSEILYLAGPVSDGYWIVEIPQRACMEPRK